MKKLILAIAILFGGILPSAQASAYSCTLSGTKYASSTICKSVQPYYKFRVARMCKGGSVVVYGPYKTGNGDYSAVGKTCLNGWLHWSEVVRYR